MKLSPMQVAILEAREKTLRNLLVVAVAGSGKSTTIRLIAESMYDANDLESSMGMSLKTLVCAFNTHIVKDLQPKMPPDCQVSTMHSLGYAAWRSHMGVGVKLDQFKTGNLLNKYFDMKSRDSKNRYYAWRGSIARVISLFKAGGPTLMGRESPWTGREGAWAAPFKAIAKDLIDYHDIKMPKFRPGEEVVYWNRVAEVWEDSLNLKTVIDYDDMIFLPVWYRVELPKFKIALFDEFQDMNPVQIDFAMMLDCRKIAVGDPKQSIYGFRGADARAIENYVKRADALELPLSVCYRCAKSIVAEAAKLVPYILPFEGNDEGTVERVKIQDYRAMLTEGDIVLCRCTAPLVSECLALIRAGRKAMVKGKKIGDNLIEIIDDLANHDDDSTGDFYNQLQHYQHTNLERLARAKREFEIIELNDRVETLIVILEDAKTVGDMKRRITSIFSDDNVKGVLFCTVHKFKGSEADNVYIVEPHLMPHPNAKSAVALEQEQNIKYVAITRAKKILRWVDGKTSDLRASLKKTKIDGQHEVDALTKTIDLNQTLVVLEELPQTPETKEIVKKIQEHRDVIIHEAKMTEGFPEQAKSRSVRRELATGPYDSKPMITKTLSKTDAERLQATLDAIAKDEETEDGR